MIDWQDGCRAAVEQTMTGYSARDALNAFRRDLKANPLTLP